MDAVTGAFIAFLVAAVPIALLTTKAVDTIRNLLDKNVTVNPVVWNFVAFVVGIAICLGWQFNLADTLADSIPALANWTAVDGIAGQVLTGLAVGAMAGFWHEKLDQWHSSAVADRAAAAVVVLDEEAM